MECHLWKIKDREEYLGSKEQLAELNRRTDGSFEIVGNRATIKERPLIMSNIVMNPKHKKKNKEVVVKATRISANKVSVPVIKDGKESEVIVGYDEPPEPMPMPSIVNSKKGVNNPIPFNDQFSDVRPMLNKAIDAASESEEPMVVPAVVNVKKK